MAKFEVVEQQGLKMIKASIMNETIRAESGALHYMLGNIELEVQMPSAKGFLKSMVTQENVFKPTYKGTGEIFFGPPIFGEYHMLQLNGDAWILDKGAYVCSDGTVEIGAHRNKAIAGLLGGEGFFQTKAEGTGTCVIQAWGPIQTIDLQNQRLTVDGSFAVARQASLNFSVKRATKGLLGSAASGEGLVNVIEGTGRVYIAPVPNIYNNLVNSVRSAFPTSSS
ncbi:AIM24 family protein [Candidatus Sumerlaeota bacterium]|nr:AIM24 family protein [Candidatus Sumerlaeota bacterium]